MLKRLRISNFQSHRASDIELHEGVNAVVGPSDCGKSATLRALRWALFNDQPGDAYRRHGSDKTEVEVVIEETGNWGTKYTRTRSNKENGYKVVGDSIDSTYDKVKGDVPEGIARAFNMDDINVQKQMDAPFLLSESPAEVGRVLNRAAGIDDIDARMSRVNSMERENSAELKTRTSDLGDLDGELARYRRLPEAEALLCAAEKLDKALRKGRDQALAIGNILNDLSLLEGKIERLEPLATVNLDGAIALHDRLRDARDTLEDVEADIEALGELGARIAALNTASLEHNVQEALAASEGLKLAEVKVDNLRRVLSDIEEATEGHEDREEQLARLQGEFDELMPDICPLCEQEAK
jgi:DNA repair exonuclease SbcCD ATPase subunit